MSDWISVKDRLPEEGQNCVVHLLKYHWDYQVGVFDTTSGLWVKTDKATREYNIYSPVGSDGDGVDFWMPLPDPPK